MPRPLSHQTGDRSTCVVCNKDVDLAEAHWLHREDCPQLTGSDRCTCNPVVHPACCPVDREVPS